MATITFSALPSLANITAATIVPVVAGNINYQVTAANLQSYVNGGAGNITSNNITATGVVQGATISATGLVQGATVSAIGNVIGGNIIFGTGIVSGTGNIFATNITATSVVKGTTVSATSNVIGGNLLTSGIVSSTGNINGNYLNANIFYATGYSASKIYNGNSNISIDTSNGNVLIYAGGVLKANFVSGLNEVYMLNEEVSVGTLYSGDTIQAVGNIYGRNLISTQSATVNGNLAIGAGITPGGFISASGNVTAAYFIGNGSQLANINAITAGTVTANAQPNITSVGHLDSLYVSGVTNLANVVTSFITCDQITLPTGGGSGLISTTGNIVSVNINAGNIVAGNISVTGTTTLTSVVEKTTNYGNVNTSITPNITVGSIFSYTLTSNVIVNLPSPQMSAGQSITLIMSQDATGNRIMTPNNGYKFAYGVNTLSTTANAIDVISVYYTGSTYLCNLVKGYV